LPTHRSLAGGLSCAVRHNIALFLPTHLFCFCPQIDGHLLPLVVLAALVELTLGGVALVSPAWGGRPRRDMSHPGGRSIGSVSCFAVSCVSASCRPGLPANG